MAITINNTATLSFNGNTVSSNTTEGQLLDTLTVSKDADRNVYSGMGDSITYLINLTNTGDSPITGVAVTDNLGGYQAGGTTVYPLNYLDGTLRYFVNGVPQTALPTVTAGPPMTITGINIPAGGNVLLVYEAVTTGYAPQTDGGSILNTVTANAGAITATSDATVTVNSTTELTIAKVMNPTTVTDGDTVNYTLVIQNTGNTPASADDLTISDTLNPPLQDISVTLNGTPLTEPSYSYDPDTGLFTIPVSVVTVPGATWTQDPVTGLYSMTPGTAVVVLTGTV